ncbi:MAG TPA: IscS subfamily cysteine desulfurase [Chloroflexota bacterium]|nr:IscS subfamily cysteine desulfurase [Chloroflexota bacterium]
MGDALIYLDYAATTPVDPRVTAAMLPFFSEDFGNPSNLYGAARTARQALDRARSSVAEVLGARPSEIIFTSGGSESDNAAIKGAVWARSDRGAHVVTTTIEHHAVLHTCAWLERFGVETTYLPVDAQGLLDPAQVAAAIRPTTALISVMHANNEIGVIQPLAEIAEIAHAHGIPLHTDAVQSMGHIPTLVDTLGVDMLSLSAHKLYGPKGIGALYVRRGTRWLPLQQGGGQERGRRAGTENVAGIVGLATALDLSASSLDREGSRLRALRDDLIAGILGAISGSRLNGHPTARLPGNTNFSFPEVDGEVLLLSLDRHRIAASSGSACTAGSIDPSHVLLALGLERGLAAGALRLTLGRHTTADEVARVITLLPELVARARLTV